VKLMIPAALVSAVVAFLTVGVSLAQAAVTTGRSTGISLPAASHGANNVGLVVAGIAILAVVVGGVVYLVVADQREQTPVMAATEPTPLYRDSNKDDQKRRAA
jgi:hypothetical protein